MDTDREAKQLLFNGALKPVMLLNFPFLIFNLKLLHNKKAVSFRDGLGK